MAAIRREEDSKVALFGLEPKSLGPTWLRIHLHMYMHAYVLFLKLVGKLVTEN